MKRIITVLFFLAAGGTPGSLLAQSIGINSNGAAPASSAVLDVNATDRGLLLPRLTTAQRNAIASPAHGLFFYNTTTDKLEYWDSTHWVQALSFLIPATNATGINPAGKSVAISATAAPAHPSAVLDIQSNTGGLLLPRLSMNERNAIASPVNGLLIYNTTTHSLHFHTTYGWTDVCGTQVSNTTGGVTTSSNTGVNTATPHPSAMLDVSSNTKGMAIPRLTQAQRDAILSPAEGLMLFNTNTQAINIYNGANQWLEITVRLAPVAPVAATHTATATQITWNWQPVNGAAGYLYNTVNNYTTATDNGNNTSYTQVGLQCNANATLYVWAYNCSGNSAAATFTQSTTGNTAVTPLPCTWNNSNTFTDVRDSKVYAQVQLGPQCWMAQNLDYGTYVTASTRQAGAGTQKYCYNNDVNNCAIYGGLYEWDEVMNGSGTCNGSCTNSNGNCDGILDHQACSTPVQGICPAGWHVPSQFEWTQLQRAISCNPSVFPYDETTNNWLGTVQAKELKAVSAGGTNSTGMNVLLAGSNSIYNGFQTLGQNGWFWTSTLDYLNPGYGAWARSMSSFNNMIMHQPTERVRGMSLRCVKD